MYLPTAHTHTHTYTHTHIHTHTDTDTNLTAIITGHGKLKSYYHRFKVVDSPFCSCGDEQTVDHVLFKCGKHRTERDKLKHTILKRGQSSPICKNDLTSNKIKFLNSIELEDA